MNTERSRAYIDRLWESSILATLMEYIRLPNKSPAFDPQWAAHGYMDQAVTLIESWCRRQPIAGMTVEALRLLDRTPLIYIEAPGSSGDTVLLYGHLDKQPEMSGWRADLGPWTPVLEGDKLYGRGGADDGYAAFAALAAIGALAEQQLPHARCVVLIEASEESGSPDLPAYIDLLAERIGTPSLVICLDSGCGNYEQLWCTTSLRGLVSADLEVRVLAEGVHSGDAGGVVPSSFRILRQLLNRLEDPDTGALLPAAFSAEIPLERRVQAEQAAAALGAAVYQRFPWAAGAQPQSTDPVELILNRTWRGALEITAAAGLPPPSNAGNVARPFTSLRLSVRLPPTSDAQAAQCALQTLLAQNPPYGAQISVTAAQAASGWSAPILSPWLAESVERASRAWFGKGALAMGEGGTIPFMAMLGNRFPHAQFLVTGVLGPGSNAHGPNEFLHLPTARRLTGCVAQVLADHYRHAERT